MTVLGASFDAPEKNRAFAEKFEFPYKLLTFDKTADVFGVEDPSDPGWPKRISFLIGPDGRIASVDSLLSSQEQWREAIGKFLDELRPHISQ